MSCRAALLAAVALAALPACRTLVEPLPSAQAAIAASTAAVPFAHDVLDGVLQQHVDAQGRVDYERLHRAPGQIERYYAQIAARSPDSHPQAFANAEHRLAYWLNAYNGAVLASVIRLHPIASVEQVGAPWYLFFLPDTAGFFYLREHVFGGDAYNLYDVENAIVRPRFADARIHFALNCASAGCPRLPDRAFDPERLDEQLDREARRFFAEERNLLIDDEARTVTLSQILGWYAQDFLDDLRQKGVAQPTLIAYAAAYAPPAIRGRLTGEAADYQVVFRPYDWRLNSLDLVR